MQKADTTKYLHNELDIMTQPNTLVNLGTKSEYSLAIFYRNCLNDLSYSTQKIPVRSGITLIIPYPHQLAESFHCPVFSDICFSEFLTCSCLLKLLSTAELFSTSSRSHILPFLSTNPVVMYIHALNKRQNAWLIVQIPASASWRKVDDSRNHRIQIGKTIAC